MIIRARYILIVLTIVSVLAIFFIYVNGENETLAASTSVTDMSGLSNKKIGFGLKRGTNNSQPDVGTENKTLLDQYKSIYLGSNDTKFVYLTFDAGYEEGYTDKILDVLKENNVKATFFLTGDYINKEGLLVKRMIDEGHTIGNHTVNHPSMPKLSDEKVKKEIQDLHTAVYEKYGYEMKYFRPPMGEYSERTLALTNSLGYTTVMWSHAYDDWDVKKQKGDEYAKSKILGFMHNRMCALAALHIKRQCKCIRLLY